MSAEPQMSAEHAAARIQGVYRGRKERVALSVPCFPQGFGARSEDELRAWCLAHGLTQEETDELLVQVLSLLRPAPRVRAAGGDAGETVSRRG